MGAKVLHVMTPIFGPESYTKSSFKNIWLSFINNNMSTNGFFRELAEEMADGFTQYFSLEAFIVVLRETIELAIIISVLLAFVHQTFDSKEDKDANDKLASNIILQEEGLEVARDESSSAEGATVLSDPEVVQGAVPLASTGSNDSNDSTLKSTQEANELSKRHLIIQIWLGGLLGLVSCFIIGGIVLTVFYVLGRDFWSVAEKYWEGVFSIVASIIISVMGIKLCRVNKMQRKWKHKLAVLLSRRTASRNSRTIYGSLTVKKDKGNWIVRTFDKLNDRYSMFFLPFITTLREGMEAVVFLGGIGANENNTPLGMINASIAALVCGIVVGIILYRSGSSMSLSVFLVASTCFLYLVAAGLFSKGVWNFELQQFIDRCGGFDVTETGHGPGSYDISISVWHVNCCNGELKSDGVWWMLFTAIIGWTNSATYGSVISYIMYWVVVIIVFQSLMYKDKHGVSPWRALYQKYKSAHTPAYERVDSQVNDGEEDRQSLDSNAPILGSSS